MCFSASASFGAGIALSVIGIASLKTVEKPSQIPFAAIPFIFSVQQITEGFLWLAFSNPSYSVVQTYAMYLFLIFAQVVWPIWVPFSIFKLEQSYRRKKTLKYLTAAGIIISLYLAYCLIVFPVDAQVIGAHISYIQDYPDSLTRYGGAVYLIVTIAPPFFSSLKGMWMLGSAILASYIITLLLYENYVVSVWCFFAAIISVVAFVILWWAKNHSSQRI